MYTFFSFMSSDCAIIYLSMMLQNICLNNSKEMASNLRKRILVNVFNIPLITSIEFDCSLIIYINFLNFFVISTTSAELNLINFVFLYLIIREYKLILTKILFIVTYARGISINFVFLLKTTLFVKCIAFE